MSELLARRRELLERYQHAESALDAAALRIEIAKLDEQIREERAALPAPETKRRRWPRRDWRERAYGGDR